MFGMPKKKGHGGRHKHGKMHGFRHGDGHHQKHGKRHGGGFGQGCAAAHLMARPVFDAGGKAGPARFSADSAACPLCENHCPASDPGCGKGAAYFDSLRAA